MSHALARIALVMTIAGLCIGVHSKPIVCALNSYSELSDRMDQQQIRAIAPHFLSWPDKLAQSFKPESDCLTRIQLSISKLQNPSDIVISIRKELDGTDLTSVTKTSEYLFLYPDKALFEFKLPNITVIPEHTYYIVFQYESEHTQDDMLCWWYDPNSTYIRGTAWQWSIENGSRWVELNYDFCFKIFSFNSQQNNTTNSTDSVPDSSEETPGFELLFGIGAIALFLLFSRRKI